MGSLYGFFLIHPDSELASFQVQVPAGAGPGTQLEIEA